MQRADNREKKGRNIHEKMGISNKRMRKKTDANFVINSPKNSAQRYTKSISLSARFHRHHLSLIYKYTMCGINNKAIS